MTSQNKYYCFSIKTVQLFVSQNCFKVSVPGVVRGQGNEVIPSGQGRRL